MEGALAEADRPIFVVGAMRSGTTLMRLVLDSHENIGIAPETGVMRVVGANKHVPFWMFGAEWYARLGVGEDELNRQLAGFYGGLLRRYAVAHGKSRWGEKTPWHVWHLDEMSCLWPEAVFVVTVRHPGGNVGSMVTKWSTPLRRAIAHWTNVNREVLRQSERLGDRVLVCRYEDLVLEPEPTLRELLERLGESWSPSVLRHDKVHRGRGTTARVEGRTRSTDAIDPSRVTSWTEHIRGSDLETLEAATAALARFFGYSFADVAAREALAADRRVVTGSEIAARRTRFADVPELHEPPVIPAVERPLKRSEVVLRRRNRRTRSRPAGSGDRKPAAVESDGGRLLARIRRRVGRLARRRP